MMHKTRTTFSTTIQQENIMLYHQLLLVYAAAPLAMGCAIYLFLRSGTLVCYRWLGIGRYVITLQDQYALVHNHVPDWIIYNLPDGLWSFSFTALTLILCKYYHKSIAIACIPGIIALVSEIYQYTSGHGTFDFADIIYTTIFSIIPFLLIKNKQL